MTKDNNQNYKYKQSELVDFLRRKLSSYLKSTLSGETRRDAIVTYLNRIASFLIWSYRWINKSKWKKTNEEGIFHILMLIRN